MKALLGRARGPLLRAALVLTLCGLVLAPAAADFTSHRDSARLADASYLSGSATKAFKVSGSARGLWPGARKTIRLRISNPNSFSIRVRSLEVRPRDSDQAGCGARWLKLQQRVDLSLKVRNGGRASVSYPVQLSKNAPDACQGARWALRFKGAAERVR